MTDGFDDANVLFRFPNNQSAGVGTDGAAIKIGLDCFPRDLRETEFSGIFFHCGCSKIFFMNPY